MNHILFLLCLLYIYIVTGKHRDWETVSQVAPYRDWETIVTGKQFPSHDKYITEQGEKVYDSQEIQQLWKKGQIEFGSVTLDSAGYVDFANGGLCYAVIDDSITESTIDLLFPSAGTYTLLLRQGDTAATVTFTPSITGSILWQDDTPPTLSLANEGDQLKFTVIEIAKGSYLVTGVHELSRIVF